jgi:hypothetical protein
MLGGLIAELVADVPGMLVEPAAAGEDLVAAGRDADVLLADEASADAPSVARLLEALPRLRAITIRGDGRDGVLYELHPYREELGVLSRATLRAALCRPRADWPV